MKIVTISDLHGKLPDNIPECDLLLIGGDICPDYYSSIRAVEQLFWLNNEFRKWLNRQPARNIVSTWGNHDWVGYSDAVNRLNLPWKVLVDEQLIIDGFKIWGSPWQPRFCDWAFNLDEPDLAKKWELIPKGIDILLLHGPPYGYGDLAPSYGRSKRETVNTGSPSLTVKIADIRPRLVVCGHIHSGYGVYDMGNGVIIANSSLVNEQCEMVNRPLVFDF